MFYYCKRIYDPFIITLCSIGVRCVFLLHPYKRRCNKAVGKTKGNDRLQKVDESTICCSLL